MKIEVRPLLTSEAARILGVAPQTLRLWEKLGHVKALKTAAGVRLFDPRDIERLARQRELRAAAGSTP